MNRGQTNQTQDNRRFGRYPLEANVYLEQGGGRREVARAVDVGRGGLAVTAAEALEPGTRVKLEVSAPGGPAETPEFKGVVAWARPAESGAGYEMGIRVYHDEPAAVQGLSALLHAGLAQAGFMDRMWSVVNKQQQPATGIWQGALAAIRQS